MCPGGIRYLEGGIESGFRHVTTQEYRPRLLHVRREQKTIKATEVRPPAPPRCFSLGRDAVVTCKRGRHEGRD